MDFILNDVIPFGAGMILCGNVFHLYSFYIWAIYKSTHNTYEHSGYEFPVYFFFLVPGSTDVDFHMYHHEKNVGNYASGLLIWDTLLGTNKFFILQKIKEEKEAELQSGKAKEAMEAKERTK